MLSDLAELLEYRPLIRHWDADPSVLYGNAQFAVAEVGGDADPAAIGGELHRIGQEVQQDLADLALVCGDEREIGRDVGRDLDAMRCRAFADEGEARPPRLGRRERRRLELHPASLDLRKVEGPAS